MGALPIDVRDRVALLVPTLSSDSAGEVAATASAIGRALKKAGCDWHDLAKLIRSGAESIAARAQPIVTPTREANEASRTSAEHRARRATPQQTASRAPTPKVGVPSHVLFDCIHAMDLDALGDRASEFLTSLLDRCDLYEHVRITAKQDQWVRGLARSQGVPTPWDEIED